MGERELGGRLRDVLRLGWIEGAWQTGAHVAERAGARAGVAHDHEGGVLLVPALSDIRAAGLLAHGVQAVCAHDRLRVLIALRNGRLDPDPVRLAQHGRVRPMRLFGVARTRTNGVEHDRQGNLQVSSPLTYEAAGSPARPGSIRPGITRAGITRAGITRPGFKSPGFSA